MGEEETPKATRRRSKSESNSKKIRFSAYLPVEMHRRLVNTFEILNDISPKSLTSEAAAYVFLLERELPYFRRRQIELLVSMAQAGDLNLTQLSPALSHIVKCMAVLPEGARLAGSDWAQLSKSWTKPAGERKPLSIQPNLMLMRQISIVTEAVSRIRVEKSTPAEISIEVVFDGIRRFEIEAKTILRRQLKRGALEEKELSPGSLELLELKAVGDEERPHRARLTLEVNQPQVRMLESVLEVRDICGSKVNRADTVAEALAIGLDALTKLAQAELKKQLDDGVAAPVILELVDPTSNAILSYAEREKALFSPTMLEPIAMMILK